MSTQFITKFCNLDLIDDGDIILFKSPINRTSLSVILGTRSNWTHIGIAIWETVSNMRRLYILDAHASSGVRKIPFDLISHRYETVYIRNIPYQRDPATFPHLLKGFVDQYINKPYVSLIRVPLIPYLPFEDPGVSCGELAARWLNLLGILSPEKSLVNYVPGDFVSGKIDFNGNPLYPLFHSTKFDSPTLLYVSIGIILLSIYFVTTTLIDIYRYCI
jgi:hypothetical protein